MIHLGVNTVLFAGFDLRTALKHIKWAGFDGAEISAMQGVCEHLVLDNWRRDAPTVKAIAGDLDVPLTAMEVGELEEERLLKAFDAGAEIGLRIVNTAAGGRQDSPEDWKKSIEMLARMAEKAEEFGMSLCVKAQVGSVIYNTDTTLQAMAEIDSPAFGIDMDPSHIHRAGEEPKVALKQVISQVRHVHIRDCKGQGPGPGRPEDQACGRGDVELFGYSKVLVEADYSGPVNLEIMGAKDYELSCCAIIAAESHGYLNACLGLCGGR